jgi:inner membrane protein
MRFLSWCLVMAMAPDLDFLLGILMGQPSRYHQGLSHSLGAAVMVSLALTLLYSRKRHTMAGEGGRFFLAYASHLVLDFWGADTRPPYGIPLFWPLSERVYLALWPVFMGVQHTLPTTATTGDWLLTIFQPVNLRAIGIEVLVLLPIALLVRALCTSKGNKTNTKTFLHHRRMRIRNKCAVLSI